MSQQNEIREGQIDSRNPDEIGVNHPAKDRKSQEKPDIKESELGRETSQMPADEHIEHRLSQIDEGTKQMQGQSDKDLGEPMESDSDTAEGEDSSGYENDDADFEKE